MSDADAHLSWRFCPRCAEALEDGQSAGRLRRLCRHCGFVHWDNPLPVLAALIEVEGRMLLARNALWPPGRFALVTGFLERDETPEEGMAREVKEETGLETRALHLIGVYEFMRRNEVIMAYHVEATGQLALGEELAEVRLVEPHRLRPWRMGTGYAVADWMARRGLPYEFLDLPSADGTRATPATT